MFSPPLTSSPTASFASRWYLPDLLACSGRENRSSNRMNSLSAVLNHRTAPTVQEERGRWGGTNSQTQVTVYAPWLENSRIRNMSCLLTIVWMQERYPVNSVHLNTQFKPVEAPAGSSGAVWGSALLGTALACALTVGFWNAAREETINYTWGNLGLLSPANPIECLLSCPERSGNFKCPRGTWAKEVPGSQLSCWLYGELLGEQFSLIYLGTV